MLDWHKAPKGEFAVDDLFDLAILVRPTTVGDGFIGEFFDSDGMRTGITPVIGSNAEIVKEKIQEKITRNVTRLVFNL